MNIRMINDLEFVNVAKIMKAIEELGINTEVDFTGYTDYVQIRIEIPRIPRKIKAIEIKNK